MKYLKSSIFLILIFFVHTAVFGQRELFSISGTVKSMEGDLLIGATVWVHELNRGTITDVDGYYKVERLRRGTYHIHVTSVGYEALTKTVQITSSLTEVDFSLYPSSLELKEVVVEGSPFKSGPLEQSMTIEMVERNFIERNSSNTFINALQKIPGISAINTGVGISKPVIRGMAFNRVIVNDRGVKQEGQQWGSDHGLEIDQYEPERVEIIKGPSSLLYGSDAMGGVINLQAPPVPREGTLRGTALAAYKSNNNLFGSSTMLEGNNDGKIFRIRFSTQDFGDFSIPADSFYYNRRILPIYNNRLTNSAGRERNLSGMVGVSKDWGYTTLTVSNFNQRAGFFPGAFGVTGEYQDDGNKRNIDYPRQVINHFKAIVNTNILLKNNWLEFDLGYQNNDRREEAFPHANGNAPVPEGTLALGLALQTFSGNFKYHFQKNEKNQRIAGIQFQYQENRKRGHEYLLPDFSSGSAGAFLYEEFQLGTVATINGGARFDYGTRNSNRHVEPVYSNPETIVDYQVRSPEISRKFYNASAATGISFYPNHDLNAKLNFGSSFRIPTAPELSSNGVHHGTFRHEIGESTLKSERGWQTDLNVTYHTENLHFGVSPFFNYFTNYIYLGPTGRFSDFREAGQAYQYKQNNAIFSGTEANLEYHIFKELHLLASVEYVWNRNLDTRLPLPFTPPLSILAEVVYNLPLQGKIFSNFHADFNAQRFAAQNRVDRNEKPTPAYTVLNFSSGFNVNVGKQTFKFILTAQNLTNAVYLNHLSRYRLLNLPEQGRNFTITLKIPFSIKS